MSEKSGIAGARERYAGAKAFVELFRAFRSTLDGDKEDTAGVGTLLVVRCTVVIGHIEGRPMNASKLAFYTGLPRTTVLRKLKTLIQLGLVVRRGDDYYIAPEHAKKPPAAIKRVMHTLRESVAAIDKHNLLHK